MIYYLYCNNHCNINNTLQRGGIIMKRFLSMLLLTSLLTMSLGMTTWASTTPQAFIYADEVSHYTDIMPIKFKLQDDKSLKDGFFVFILGNPGSSDAVQLYAERITEDSNSVVLTREIDITPCYPNVNSPIYLVVIDADGNESNYTTYETVMTNKFLSPAIRVKNPTTDASDNSYRQYIGSYPTFNPTITITDYDSTSFTCKYYIDNTLQETKSVTVSGTGTHTLTFNNPINISSLSAGYHNIKFEVTDGSNTGSMVMDL